MNRDAQSHAASLLPGGGSSVRRGSPRAAPGRRVEREALRCLGPWSTPPAMIDAACLHGTSDFVARKLRLVTRSSPRGGALPAFRSTLGGRWGRHWPCKGGGPGRQRPQGSRRRAPSPRPMRACRSRMPRCRTDLRGVPADACGSGCLIGSRRRAGASPKMRWSGLSAIGGPLLTARDGARVPDPGTAQAIRADEVGAGIWSAIAELTLQG